MSEVGSPLIACEVHKRHSPVNLTVELHHIVPVAWQLTWQPAVAPYPGIDRDGRGMLWDARGLNVCPTGHRNIHAWIVRMMRALPPGSEDPQAGFAGAGCSARDRHAKWALEALVRFKAVGGSLAALVAAGEWGMA